ncbi:MAG: heavy-metal-associated domain-containing protein [Hyphomicrobiales bacterium]
MNTLQLNIQGMRCDGCADRICALLDKEIGIRKVSISWADGTGRIVHNPQATSQDRIIAIIENAGFTTSQA